MFIFPIVVKPHKLQTVQAIQPNIQAGKCLQISVYNSHFRWDDVGIHWNPPYAITASARLLYTHYSSHRNLFVLRKSIERSRGLVLEISRAHAAPCRRRLFRRKHNTERKTVFRVECFKSGESTNCLGDSHCSNVRGRIKLYSNVHERYHYYYSRVCKTINTTTRIRLSMCGRGRLFPAMSVQQVWSRWVYYAIFDNRSTRKHTPLTDHPQTFFPSNDIDDILYSPAAVGNTIFRTK